MYPTALSSSVCPFRSRYTGMPGLNSSLDTSNSPSILSQHRSTRPTRECGLPSVRWVDACQEATIRGAHFQKPLLGEYGHDTRQLVVSAVIDTNQFHLKPNYQAHLNRIDPTSGASYLRNRGECIRNGA